MDLERGQVPDGYQGDDGSDPFLNEPGQDLTGDGDRDAPVLQEPSEESDAGDRVVQGPETGPSEATAEPSALDSVPADTALTLDQVRSSQQTAETELQQANTATAASDAALESCRNSYVPEWAKAGEAYKANPEAFERHWRTVTERNLEQANTAAERLNAFVEEHGTELDEAKFKQYQQLRAAYEEPLQEIARARGFRVTATARPPTTAAHGETRRCSSSGCSRNIWRQSGRPTVPTRRRTGRRRGMAGGRHRGRGIRRRREPLQHR